MLFSGLYSIFHHHLSYIKTYITNTYILSYLSLVYSPEGFFLGFEISALTPKHCQQFFMAESWIIQRNRAIDSAARDVAVDFLNAIFECCKYYKKLHSLHWQKSHGQISHNLDR